MSWSSVHLDSVQIIGESLLDDGEAELMIYVVILVKKSMKF